MVTRALVSLLIPAAMTVSAPASAMAQDAPVRIWLNQDGQFVRGDKARVEVRTDRDGYLLVLHADPSGRVRVLFPLDPREDNFARGGKKYEVRSRGDRDAFYVDDSYGTGLVYAALSLDPFRFDEYVRGDHWDYRRLRVSETASDAELELTRIVEGMVPGGGFDYDVLPYDVIDPSAYSYASTSYLDGGYGCYYCGDRYHGYGSRLHIGIGFGSRYYDPFYYSPLSYYDPWYYPRYYYPSYYYPRYYRPFYWYPYDGFYYPYRSGRTYGRFSWPSNPYRFKGGTFGDRDRRAIQPRDRRRGRSTSNLADYRTRGDDPLGVRRPMIERTRRLSGREVRVDRPTARRPAPRETRGGSAVDQGRSTERRRAAPSRAEPRRAGQGRVAPRRTSPQRAEPRQATPRRVTPRSTAPRKVQRRAPSSRSAAPRRVGRTSRRSVASPAPSAPRPSRAARRSPRRTTAPALGPAPSSGPRRVGRTSPSRGRVQARASGPRRVGKAPSRSSTVRSPSRGSSPRRSVSRGSSSRGGVGGGSVRRAPSSRGSSGARGGGGRGGRRGR